MTVIAALAAFFVFIAFIVAVARLGRGVEDDIGGLFARVTVPDRALRMQENDLPPFRFSAQGA